MDEKIKKIKEVLDQIRPYLNMEGGDVEFIKYEDDYVYIKFYGACVDCAMMDVTIEDGIYSSIKEVLPECKGVINTEI
ncbi:MAG: NifU family protein [Bacilli bacterium]|jgi:Fe-S cluster biogenesis protein NfuA|nr:NifU family protein [Bacilli bacterium]